MTESRKFALNIGSNFSALDFYFQLVKAKKIPESIFNFSDARKALKAEGLGLWDEELLVSRLNGEAA